MVELTPQQQQMYKGLVCPYCNKSSELVDSKEIYGTSYGMIYLCRPCDAYVGVHKGTTDALGRLANKELREAKKEAHKYFDLIWKTKQMTRTEAYQWLSNSLNTPKDYTHIGMFNVKSCQDVVFYSKQLLNDLRRLDLDMGAEPKTEFFKI